MRSRSRLVAHSGHTIQCAMLMLLLIVTGCTPLPLTDSPIAQIGEPQESQLLRIATCWEAKPLVEDLTSLFEKRHQSIAVHIETGNAHLVTQWLSQDKVDVALIAAPLKNSGISDGELPATLTYEPLAQTALAIIVHRDNPLTSITLEDLRDLYSGYILDWQSLGAISGQPQLVSRQQGTRARELFDSLVLQPQELSSAALLLPHEAGIVDYVGQHRLATGYVSLAALDERVRVIPVDGVVPSLEAVSDKSYPLVISIDLLIPSTTSAEAEMWVDLLRSREGLDVVERSFVRAD